MVTTAERVEWIRGALADGWRPDPVDVEFLLAELDRLRTAHDVDRLGYAVVEKDASTGQPTGSLAIDSLLWSRNGAERARHDCELDNQEPGLTYAIAEVHEAEETPS